MNHPRLLSLLLVVLVGWGCSTDDAGSLSEGSERRSGSSAADASKGSGAGGTGLAPPLVEALESRPSRATTAQEVTEQIVAAERAIADPRTAGDILAAAGHLQQVAYRQLGTHPQWDARVLAAVPSSMLGVVRDNVASRREFRSMHSELSETLPAWRIVRPAPAAELLAAYRAAESRFGVAWEYLAAINLVETGMGRIRGTSVAGAQGPMQFIPSTWAAYGRGDINSPRDAIMAAARYLDANGFDRPGGIPGALYRYNNSTAYVRGVTLLAEVMQRRPRAYDGYYHWQVYYLTARGDVLLPHGYASDRPIPVERWRSGAAR